MLSAFIWRKIFPFEKNCLWKNFEQKKTYEKIYAPSPLNIFLICPYTETFLQSEIAQVTHFNESVENIKPYFILS